jgi:hypothetical protein
MGRYSVGSLGEDCKSSGLYGLRWCNSITAQVAKVKRLYAALCDVVSGNLRISNFFFGCIQIEMKTLFERILAVE